MIELSVENLHLTYGDNPVLKGVSMTLGRRGGVVAGAFGKRAKPRYCGRWPGWKTDERTDRHRQPHGVYDGTPRSEIPAEERNLGLVFQSYALAAQNGVRQRAYH